MFNDNKLQVFLEKYPKSTFWVAYSGGLDSQVLLHSLLHILPTTRLRAIHVNHGLHSDAAQWVETCQLCCAQFGIHCDVITVDAQPKQGKSPEACAREARYVAMVKLLPGGDCLLTAHHRDDQAETLLLQSLRGAGLRGLASMPTCMPFGEGYLIRPLLSFTRAELHHYAKAKQLTWIEDSSNANLRFNRNFIRHQILPLLHQRWPEASKMLARVAENAAEGQQLLEELAYEDCLKVQGPCKNSVVISRLLQLSPARLRNCLRYWLNQLHFPLPSQKQLQQIEHLLESKIDAMPQVNYGGMQVRRYRDFLYARVLKKEIELPCLPVAWGDLTQDLVLPTLGVLEIYRVLGNGIACERLKDTTAITVGFRQGGERFYRRGRLGSHPLKKLFQEWSVPPWQRKRVPLIYYQEELIAVAGYGVKPNFLASVNEWGYVISLKPA
ncbi:MAG: tRNA lysidine(34) synthetase TilS [Pseudomonadota bacterium]